MMKKQTFLILLCLALCILVCGCGPSGGKVYPFRSRCYFGALDRYAYMTDLSTMKSYTASDGTEYLPEDGGELWVVTGKLQAPQWNISEKTYLKSNRFKSYIPLFCDPILEESENGESMVTLLFCVKETDFDNELQSSVSMELILGDTAGEEHIAEFVLMSFRDPPNTTYQPVD